MSLTATVLRELIALGVTGDALVAAVERIESAHAASVEEAVAKATAKADAELAERKAKAAQSTRRYRERGGDAIPWQVRTAVFERDMYTCCDCGTTENLECDHIIPVSKGGGSEIENLQALCRSCNARKRDRIRKADERKIADNIGHSRRAAEDTGKSETPPSRAQVVISNSSLRSELLDTPKKPSVSIPKGTDEKRGSRLPDDWNPVPDYDPHSFGLSVEQHDAELAKFRDYWRSVPGAKGRKQDWPATWRNWMRRAAENQPRKPHAQPYPDQKHAARLDNYRAAFEGAEAASRSRQAVLRSG